MSFVLLSDSYAKVKSLMKPEKKVKLAWDLIVSTLGSGQSEAVYQRALASQLSKTGLFVRTEVPCPVFFENECVGAGRADIVLPGLVIELKLSKGILPGAKRQAQNYANSLTQIEQCEYRAIVLACDPETGETYDFLLPKSESKSESKTSLTQESKPEPRAEPNTAKNESLLNAFKAKYKAAVERGTWVDTTQVHAHLMRFLERKTPEEKKENIKQKVDSFLRKNFKFTTQSRNATKRPKRVRVCFPK